MTTQSPLEVHVGQLVSAAKTISSFTWSNGHEKSIDEGSLNGALPTSAPQNVRQARQDLIESATKIQQMAIGPNEYLPYLALQYQYLACLRWLCQFSVLSILPADGSMAYSDVARAAKVPESQLKRIARMAMTSNFLCEPKPDRLAHNPTSSVFASNSGHIDWALLLTELSAPTAAKMVEVTEKFGDSKEKNETAFNISRNTDLSYFDSVSHSPLWRKRFASYMQIIGASESTSLKHLLSGFDWAGLGAAKIVDVGGSTGHASIALATAFPDLKFVVQDLPENVVAGPANLRSHPDSVRSRIEFASYNFFEPQVLEGADVYLFRTIFHDWPDVEAKTILRNHIQALEKKPGSRLIIMDTVLPTPGTAPMVEEALLRYRDLTMMQMFNSKEREIDDWKGLYEQVDKRLVIKRVQKPFGSNMSVMEVGLDAN